MKINQNDDSEQQPVNSLATNNNFIDLGGSHLFKHSKDDPEYSHQETNLNFLSK